MAAVWPQPAATAVHGAPDGDDSAKGTPLAVAGVERSAAPAPSCPRTEVPHAVRHPDAVKANAATPLPVTAMAAAGSASPGGVGTRDGVVTVGTRRSGRAWPVVARPQA